MSDLPKRLRKTIEWLNRQGFKTTDSGDGQNHADGMECALEFVHIVVVADPGVMAAEADRLHLLFSRAGVDFGKVVLDVAVQNGEDPASKIEATYDPQDEVATIIIYGVEDSDFDWTTHSPRPR